MLPLEFDLLRQIISQFVSALPTVGGAIVLVIFGIWLAHIIRSLLTKVFTAFDLNTKTQHFIQLLGIDSDTKWEVSARITQMVYYIVILFVVAAAAQILGLSIISQQIAQFTAFLPHLLTGLLVIIFSAWAANFVKQSITTTTASLGISSGRILGQLGFYIVLGLGIATGLRQAGLQLDFLTAYLNIIIASLGFAFALSYGLAARHIFESFIGGFYARDKVYIGETIKINDLQGEVIDIDSSTLWLRTETGTLLIPLSRLTTEIVEKIVLRNSDAEEEIY
jgi:hypothetical protein